MLLVSFYDRLRIDRCLVMHNSTGGFDLKYKTTSRSDAVWYFFFCFHSSLNRSRTRILLRLDSNNRSTIGTNKACPLPPPFLFLVGFGGEKLSFLGRVHEWTVLPFRIARIQLIDGAQFDLVH